MASDNGAYTLGQSTEGTLLITVTKPGDVTVPLAATVGVEQAGDIDFDYTTGNDHVTDAVEGRNAGVLVEDWYDGDNYTWYGDGDEVDTDPITNLDGMPDVWMDETTWGEDPTPLDQWIENPSDNSNYYGDDPITGEAPVINPTANEYFGVSNLADGNGLIYAMFAGSEVVDNGYRYTEAEIRQFVTSLLANDLNGAFSGLPNPKALDYTDLLSNEWDDAGEDIYDGGNMLYVDGQLQSIWTQENSSGTTTWGDYNFYTTAAADNGTVLTVTGWTGNSALIEGNMGADGSGGYETGELTGFSGVRVFFAQNYGAGDPSLVKIFITDAAGAQLMSIPTEYIGEGVDQSYVNPNSDYDAIDNSAAYNGEDSSVGDASLDGSDPGVYDDLGLNSTHYNDGTMTGEDYYAYSGSGNPTDKIDIDDGSGEDSGVAGEAEGTLTDGTTDEDSFLTDPVQDGFAPFDWDNAVVLTRRDAQVGPDVVWNFQAGAGHDVVALEGALYSSTVNVGGEDGSISGVDGYQATESVWQGEDVADWSGSGDTFGLPTMWSIDLGVTDASQGFTIDFSSSPRLHIVGTDTNGGWNRLVADLSAEPMHFENVAAFQTYIEQAFYEDNPSALSAAEAITWSFNNGVLTADVGAASLEFDTSGSYNSAWHYYQMAVDISYGQDFDLSQDEFGLVRSTNSDVLAASLSDVDAVAAMLNSHYNFSGTSSDSVRNTSVFAVTAQDDATQTAIWVHEQSNGADSTVDAHELSLLAIVHTTGTEFQMENFYPLTTQVV